MKSIRFIRGNILDSDCDALVNTVNCVAGVWGKGLALAFKNAFPECYKSHTIATENGNVKIGKMFVCKHLYKPYFVICFPTKNHWINPSRIEYISEGLVDLKKVIEEEQIKSIAIPALGCANGRLNWDKVKYFR